jgi:hypothetical protein
MKPIFSKYAAVPLLCIAFLVTGTAALAQDSKKKTAQQAEPPSYEPGPGPTSSRPDTTGTPGTMSKSSKSAKQQMKECVAHTRANNTSVSESDAQKACQEAVKAQKDNAR